MKEKSANKSWEQLPDESDLAYQRFSVYLQLGAERSLDAVLQECNKSSTYRNQLARWSSKHSWVQRSGDYDRYLIAKALKHKEEILDRGMARLLGMMDKALDELEAVLDMDNILRVGDGATTVVNQKLKAIDIVLNRIGLVEQKELPDIDKDITINEYVQNIYNQMRLHKRSEGVHDKAG